MALVSVVKRAKNTTIGTDTEANANSGRSAVVITLDCSLTETHSGSNTITDHPVEQGFNVTDHSRPEPDRLQIVGIISNTPLSVSQQTRAINSGSITFDTNTQTSAPRDTPGRAEAAYVDLLKLKDSGTLLTVVTTLRAYNSMMIETVSVPRDPKLFDAVEFTVTFKKIRVVENKLTQNVVAKDPRAKNKIKTGTQTTKDEDAETSPLQKTVNKGKVAIDKIGGFLGGG